MAIIYSYPQAIPKGSDLIIGTVTYDPDDPSPVRGNPTRSFKISDLASSIKGNSYTLSSKASGANSAIVLTDNTGFVSGLINFNSGSGMSVLDAGNTVTITNTGVLSTIAGTGISLSNAAGNVTISNSGVTGFTVVDSTYINLTSTASTGAVTLSAALNATGVPTELNFLRGDNVWATPAGGGTVTSVNAGTGIAVDNTDPDNPIISNTGVLSNIGGTGISISGSTGNSTITNTAPDQTVILTGGGGTTISGTYPSFTITSVDGKGVEAVVAGAAISVDSSDPANPIVTNTSPDQIVSISGSGGASVTGAYPNFNVYAEPQPSLTGYITGSGVTNQLAIWNGTDDLRVAPINVRNNNELNLGALLNASSLNAMTALIHSTRIYNRLYVGSTGGPGANGDVLISTGATTDAQDGLDWDSGTKYLKTTTTDISTFQSVDDDITLGGGSSSNTLLASQLAIKTYVDNNVAGGVIYQGGYDAATNTPDLTTSPNSILKGWMYTVTVEGTFYGETLRVGDVVISNIINPTSLADWTTVQSNIDLATAGTSITATRGLAGFDENNFTVANGFVNLKVGDIIPSNIVQSIVAGIGITVDNTDPENPIVTNIAPDQTVVITGTGGATVTGTYPNFNIDTTDATGVDSIIAGTSISIDNTDPANPIVNNTDPDQTVVLNQGNNITITGTYPSFTIAAADAPAQLVTSVNTQIGAVVLDTDDIAEGTTNLYDKTVVITGSGGATITGNYPNFNIDTTDATGVDSVVAGTNVTVDNTDPKNPIVSASGNPIPVSEEGVQVTPSVASFNFTGAGVTATAVGNDVTVNVAQAQSVSNLVYDVRNQTGAEIPAGSAVYIQSGSGSSDHVNVVLALADSDLNSSKTFGITTLAIPNNSIGPVTLEGIIEGIDTSLWQNGDTLWLSPTVPGGIQNTIPSTPAHAVFLGYAVRIQQNNGSIFAKIQNGAELSELHDVLITNVQPGQTITWDSLNSYWKNTSVANSVTGGNSTFIDTTTDVTTGAVTVTSALNATGTPGATNFLRGDNQWSTAVTSIAAGTGLNGGTITTTGNISLADTAVAPGAYTNANITVDQQGRITLASNGDIGVASFTASSGTFISLSPITLQTGAVTLTSDLSASGTADSNSYLRGDNTWATPVNSLVTTNGTYIDLTPITAATGAVTVTADLSASGTADNTTFLRGDNQWVTVAGTTYDYSSAQSGSNVNLNLIPSTGTTDTVTLVAGSGITLTDNGSNNVTVAASASGGGTIEKNDFTGTGSQTQFILTTAPASILFTDVYINGVYQEKETYSVTGTSLDFTTAPPLNVSIEVMSIIVSNLLPGANTLTTDSFVSTGSLTYTLSTAPPNEDFTTVYVSGVYQEKSTYSVSGTTLTFTEAPVTGDTIEVVIISSASLVNTAPANYNVSVISTSSLASKNTLYVLKGDLTLTLPSSPDAGDSIKISNLSGVATCIIARNGNNIMATAADLTLDNAVASFELVYTDATNGWVIIGPQ